MAKNGILWQVVILTHRQPRIKIPTRKNTPALPKVLMENPPLMDSPLMVRVAKVLLTKRTDGVGDLDSADDCSDSDDENTVVLDVHDVGILMVKCRKLINTVRKSSILNDALLNLARDTVSVELVPDMKIHWNSTYRMIQRLLLHQNILGVFYDSLDTIDGVTAKQRKKLIEAKTDKPRLEHPTCNTTSLRAVQ